MPSVAPLVAAFRRRLANLPGPVRASGEASNGEPVVVEMLAGGVWVDITSYAMVRDDSGSIGLKAGILGGEGSQTDRGQATLQLRNDDGRFSPRNPSGPYFGQIGRNTPFRISVPDGNGGKAYRLWGEASAWELGWDRSGNDVWVDVEVNGVLQRLAQGPVPERSVIYRAITDPLPASVVAYWPCEDPEGSASMASALTTGSPMRFSGSPQLAAYDGFGSSDPLPTLTGASLTGGVARYDMTAVTEYQLRYLLAIPAAGISDVDTVSRIRLPDSADMVYLDVHYNDPPGGLGSFGAAGTLSLVPKNGDQTSLAVSGTQSLTMDVRGRRLLVSVEVANNGANLAMTLRVLDLDSGVEDTAAIGYVNENVTLVQSVSVGPATLDSSVGAEETAVGHIMLQTDITAIDALGTRLNTEGETAGRRIQRLCGEDGIPFEWVGDLDDTAALGAQGRQNTLSLVQEAVLADGGLLYETTSGLGLGYRTRASLYNQDPALTLSYTGYQFAEVPVPVEDDRYIQNQLTVTANGVSGTYEETEGPLSTALPPAGVGVYGDSDQPLNLASSDAAVLRDHAAWRVHLGTVDEARYPKVTVNLAHPSITPELKRAILALRLGDRAQFTGMPAWLPPDTVDQLIFGREETLTHFEHRLTFICGPASPYTVGVLDSAGALIDTDGSQLVSAVSSSATSLVVAPSAGASTLWTTDSGDLPFDVRLSGEVMRVTAVSPWLTDAFGRTSSNSWGTADSGQAWSQGGGTSADYAVGSGVGTHTLATVNASRRSFTEATFTDFDYYGDITTSATATGGSLFGGLSGRYLDSSFFYTVRVEFTTANALILSLRKFVNASESQLATYSMPDTYSAGTWVRVRFQASGSTLRARAWLATEVEPSHWMVSVTDNSISNSSFVGTRSIAASANTNVSPVVSYDNLRVISPQTFTVTRSVNGVTKAQTAGTDVRLNTPTIIAL